MTPEDKAERRRQQMIAARRRWRERHPEYEQTVELARNRRRRAAMTPEQREAERDRIRLYRATHPAETYVSNLRSRRRRGTQ